MNPGTSWEQVDRCARLFHERAAVHLLSGVLVVRTAEQADSVRSVEMRSREPVAVIEFQGACLGAPPPTLVRERAAAAVASEDLAFDGVRDVTRGRCVRLFGRNLSRLPTRRESLLLHVLDEQVECALEDRRQVSVGNAVAEEILGETELADAEGEHRGEGPVEVELPLVDLTEMDEKRRLDAV